MLNKYKEKVNWSAVSKRRNLNWSFQLLEEFEDYWDWIRISGNYSIKWTEKIIDRFKNRLTWESYDGGWLKTVIGISENSLPWSIELIEKYEEKWGWKARLPGYINYGGLTSNSYINWDEKLISRFQNKIDWKGIKYMNITEWTPKVIEIVDKNVNIKVLSEKSTYPWTISKFFENEKSIDMTNSSVYLNSAYWHLFKKYINNHSIDRIMKSL